MNATHDKILVALDFDTADEALALAQKLVGSVGGFKVGLELVNAAGLDIFDRLRDIGVNRLFYDAKFHDIPNTVASAVKAAARRGLWMINVHASGGSAMLRAARDAADSAVSPPLLIGVTLLTSLDAVTLSHDLRVSGTVEAYVRHLARLAQQAGLDGVVASTLELRAIRSECGEDFITVVPGVRPAGVAANDQARVATPAAAVADGADYIVIGRAITRAVDPVLAARAINEEIASAAAAASFLAPSLHDITATQMDAGSRQS